MPGKKPSLNGNEHAAGALLVRRRSGPRSARRGCWSSPPTSARATICPARIIKADLEEEIPGREVEIANGLEAMGRIVAAVVRGGSRVTFRWMPWLFDIQYWLITKFAPTRWLAHHLGYAVRRPRPDEADRRARTGRGRSPPTRASPPCSGCCARTAASTIPVQSAITDLAGLRYWAHPGVDLHYVTHPESIEEVERLVGPGSVEWMRPPISRDFLMPRTRRDAREALEVPAHARLVLVSGGGWGIGDLEGAIDTALVGDDTMVVCITGRNEVAREKLEQRFGDNERVRILGFTEQMSDWMAAADAMVHATAGLTVLEAHIRGCPVVSYGFSAGHLRANNAAFERFGLAEVARSEHELESMLRHVTRERRSPDSSFASLPSIASRVLSVRPRVKPAAGLAAAGGQGRRRGQPRRGGDRAGRQRQPCRALGYALSRDLEGGEAARGTHPLRQGHRHRRRPPCSVHVRRERPPPCTPPPATGIDPTPTGRGGLDRRRRARRAGAGAGRARCRPALVGVQLRQEGAEGVALTFDDGPHPQGTPAVLETLRERGATATFFLAGEQVARRPALAAEIVAAGHRVELHCHRHRNLLRLGVREFLDDAERARAAIEEASRPGDRRLPAALRHLQRRDAAGGAPPRLAAGALVALGKGLGAASDARVDRPSLKLRHRRRRHRPPPRRRLLQRARLLGPDRGSAAAHPRRSSRAAG